jgi:uncharacterized small protein (TIGR04563 family)
MATTDKQKQSLYFPEDTLREIAQEANRLDRSLSWMVQQAWRLARDHVRQFPSVVHRGQTEDERPPEVAQPRADEERPAVADRQLPSLELREFLRGKFDRELTS